MTFFSALHRRRRGGNVSTNQYTPKSGANDDVSFGTASSVLNENYSSINENGNWTDDKTEKEKKPNFVIKNANTNIQRLVQRMFQRCKWFRLCYYTILELQKNYWNRRVISSSLLGLLLFVVLWNTCCNNVLVSRYDRPQRFPFRMSQEGDDNVSWLYIFRYSSQNQNSSLSLARYGNTFLPFHYHEWQNEFKSAKPDFGSLKLSFFQLMSGSTSSSFEYNYVRQIRNDPDLFHGHVWKEDEYEMDWKVFDNYYAFDDDYIRNIPFQEIKRHCRRTAFHRLYHPNCNVFHEIPMQMATFLGEGGYREAYLLQERYDPELVVKVNRFHHNPFEYDRYEFIRMDALVMERLTASPRIVDIYGHCATSVNTEFLPNELDQLIIPGSGTGKHLNDTLDVDPQNDFTITQKLDYALQMAESIADLHGFKDGVIVHDDIQTVQFLFTSDGRLKLNDFNRAEAMLFDEAAGEYCKYRNGAGGGDYRAPEEYVDGRLNEKIDTFSFGNNIYALLTGLWNFYELGDKVQKKIDKLKAGELPYVDPRYRDRNYIQDRLIHVMEKCWKFDPDERADIFWAVKYLRETKENAIKMGFYDDQYVNLRYQDWPVVHSHIHIT